MQDNKNDFDVVISNNKLYRALACTYPSAIIHSLTTQAGRLQEAYLSIGIIQPEMEVDTRFYEAIEQYAQAAAITMSDAFAETQQLLLSLQPTTIESILRSAKDPYQALWELRRYRILTGAAVTPGYTSKKLTGGLFSNGTKHKKDK